MLKQSVLFLAVTVSLTGFARNEKTVYSDYQCWAQGNHFRVKDSKKSEYLVDSRLAFEIKIDPAAKDKDGEAKLSYIGHIAFKKFVPADQKQIDTFDGYSQFLTHDHASVLSPRATTYPDEKWFHFKDVAEVASTSQDGGGANGTLVIAKNYATTKTGFFSAHYYFQHGDHTGGTIDYKCAAE